MSTALETIMRERAYENLRVTICGPDMDGDYCAMLGDNEETIRVGPRNIEASAYAKSVNAALTELSALVHTETTVDFSGEGYSP